MSKVTIRGLTKAFGRSAVLNGVDLDVPAGSITAILGPSGCGKTTLLRLIAGFDAPDAGTIEIGDRVVVDRGRVLAPEHRHVGYVAQEGALFPHLDVAANIGFGLKRRDDRRVAELLDVVGLDSSFAHRSPHELSGGQQQRVALARALAPAPGVILLDEPFSALDAGQRDLTRRAVRDALVTVGATALLVTHDQAEALSLANQVAVMRGGRIAQVGSPAEVYHTPIDIDLARFLGEAIVVPASIRDGVATCVLGKLLVEHGENGPASVLIRPEQITLAEPTRDAVTARVVDVTFYGPYATVQLALAGSDAVIPARVPGYAAPQPGIDVALTIESYVISFPEASLTTKPATLGSVTV